MHTPDRLQVVLGKINGVFASKTRGKKGIINSYTEQLFGTGIHPKAHRMKRLFQFLFEEKFYAIINIRDFNFNREKGEVRCLYVWY